MAEGEEGDETCDETEEIEEERGLVDRIEHFVLRSSISFRRERKFVIMR